MTIELDSRQEQIIREQLASGRFGSVNEVITSALSALPRSAQSGLAVVERMMEFAQTKTIKLPAGEHVDDLVRQARRY